MNNATRRFLVSALLVSAFTFSSTCASAQVGAVTPPDDTNAVPARLPIGSEQEIRDWIVSTNFFQYKKTYLGIGATLYSYNHGKAQPPIQAGISSSGFDSYQSFLDYVADAAMTIVGMMKTNSAYVPDSDVWYVLSLDFNEFASNVGFEGLFSSTNVGPLTLLSHDTFVRAAAISAPVIREYVVMRAANLTRLEIHRDTPKPSWYVWTNGIVSTSTNWATYRPANTYDFTTNGYISLARYLCTRDYPMRVTVGVGKKIMTYTEYGDPLVPPQLEMTGKGMVKVTAARGTKVSISESDDLLRWAICTNFTLSTSITSISMNPGVAHKFYKVSGFE